MKRKETESGLKKDLFNISDRNVFSLRPTRGKFKLEQILAENRYNSERDAMKKMAEKYGVRPEMDEIFSILDKKVRLTNSNPLELDNEKPEEKPPVQEDETTEATVQAQLAMDSEEDNKIINLTPMLREGTRIAEDVIEDSPEFSEVDPELGTMFSGTTRYFEVSGVKSPTVRINTSEIMKRNSASKKPAPDAKTVKSKVSVYQQDSEVEKVHVKAGRFSAVVKSEYEQYLRSKNPSISQVIRTEMNKVENAAEEDPRSKQEKLVSAVVGFFSGDSSDDSDVPINQVVTVDDYNGKEDTKSIF